MGSGNKLRGVLIALLAAALTAAALYWGNGLMPVWPLMWVAPLPVLLYALASRAWWRSGMVAFAAWLVGGLNLLGYMRHGGVPFLGWLMAFGVEALVFALGVLLMRGLARRGAVWSAWVALPAVWVTFEYVRNLLWPHGSAACLGYSQLNFLPFLQTASLAGPWGMGFVLLLFSAGLALGIAARGSRARVLMATVGVVGAVLIFGAVRMMMRQPGPVVRVGLVASDANPGVAGPGAPAEELFALYASQADGLIARGAEVVVMPENLGVMVDPDVGKVDGIFESFADRTGALLVVGANHISGAVRHNEARVYAPGRAVASYDKEHLLPPFENIFTPGTQRTLIKGVGQAAGDTWGVAICKDMDFTEPARGYGRASVGLMMSPAWDFKVDGFWHGHIARMRAVEDGFSLARAARNGLLYVSDDRGRVVGETPSNAAEFGTLLAEVPTAHDGTLFLLLGDWFAWVAMALAAIVVARVWIVPRQVRETKDVAMHA
jgi:apolipoprotein N-acyltransferase